MVNETICRLGARKIAFNRAQLAASSLSPDALCKRANDPLVHVAILMQRYSEAGLVVRRIDFVCNIKIECSRTGDAGIH